MRHPRHFLRASGALALCLALSPLAVQAGEDHRCPESMDHCVRTMVTRMADRGWVGIEMDRPEGQPYLVIHNVVPGSPAEEAGLKPGDALVGFNGIPYTDANKEKLEAAYKREMTIGNTITYTVARRGQRKDIRVELAAIPEPVLAQWIGNHLLQYHGLEQTRTADANKP